MIYISLDTNFLNVSKYKNLEKFELNSNFYEMYDLSKNKACIDKCEVLLLELVYRELLQHEMEAYRKVYDTVRQYAMQLKVFFYLIFGILRKNMKLSCADGQISILQRRRLRHYQSVKILSSQIYLKLL